MDMNQLPCSECGTSITVTYSQSVEMDNTYLLCPFCATAQFKAFQHVEFITWIDCLNFADFQHYEKLNSPKIDYIWK